MKFINDYPYTNMTAQNIDWLIKAVVDLIHQGKTDEEIKNAPGISEAYSAFCNAYPYTNMTMQNIDWLISAVRELYDKEATLEENVVKIEAQIQTLQADVDNVVNKFGDKVDKLNVKNNVYVTDGSTPPKTTGIQYLESPLEGTIPIRDGIGSLQVPTAQDATQAVNKGQMDTALDGKVDKTTEPLKFYGTDSNGNPYLYQQESSAVAWTVPIRNGNGALVAAAAQQGDEVVNLTQMDTALQDKVNKTTARQVVYARNSAGNEIALSYDSEATVGVAVRGQNGVLKVGTPVANNDATTKEYVDNASNGKLDKNNSIEYAAYMHIGNTQSTIRYTATMNNDEGSDCVVLLGRDSNGRSQVNEPVGDKDIANKKYVDDAIATVPTGGWTTILDKTWTEDETTDYSIFIDIPTEYQKAMSELRMIYYNNTPQAGAVYSIQNVDIGLYDGEKALSFMYTGNILPTQDTKEVTVNFASNTNTNENILGGGSSDLSSLSYAMLLYKDTNGNAVQPIPTDPNVLLNTSKIIGNAETGPNDTTEYILNSCLPNRSHHYKSNSTQTTVNYTSNDYYNDQLPNCIVSQILTSTDTTNLPVGAFVCVERADEQYALNISISFTSTTSVSYKNVVTRQAVIVGESFQVIAGAESKQNTMTNFNDVSIYGNPLPSGFAYYSYLKNGYPTKVQILPKSSTSNGVTAKKIYAGSRLVLQARY